MGLLFWRKTQDTEVTVNPENTAATEDTPLPVRLYPGDDDGPQTVALTDTSEVLPQRSEPFNLTLTTADTEYYWTIPAGCRQFEWQCRTEAAVRHAFETGKVATPVAPYKTLKAGDYYYSGLLGTKSASRRLYFASATAGVVIEGEIWT